MSAHTHRHAPRAHSCLLRGCFFLVLCCLLLIAAGCGSGTANSATSTPTPTPTPAVTAGPLSISAPSNNATVTSPIQFSGSVGDTTGVDHTRLLLDGADSIFYGGILPLKNKWMFLPTGQHNLTFAGYDKSDKQIASSTITLNVSGQTSPAVLSQLQNIPEWQWCTAQLNGSVCAAGLGNATSVQTLHVPSPSLSGSSAQFSIGGTTGYSNSLWWLSLGGGTPLSKFTYALDFYVDNADVAEALEFDVNQSFGGVRYTWGTECSYKNTKMWDVWDPKGEKWIPSKVPCPPVTSKQWHHLSWQFEKVNNQVHYISVTLDGQTTPVDMFLDPQPNWLQEDIDIAFQMDGDGAQTPYNVWLDNVSLTASY